MANNNEWKRAESGSGLKTDRTWDPVTEKELQGVYVEMKELTTKDVVTKQDKKVNLYVVKDSKGQLIAVWGTAMLDRLMKEPTIGDEVKITFVKKSFNKETGKSLKEFTVDYRSVEDKKSEEVVAGKDPEDDLPF
jgi:phage FluMu protein gp41